MVDVKVFHKEIDISNLVKSVEVSGDNSQAARKSSISLVSSPTDTYLKKVFIALGDEIIVTVNGKEFFRGIVFTKEKSIDGSQLQLSLFDRLIYLLKSKGNYVFSGVTADNIARKVCGDYGIEVGYVAPGIPITRVFEGVELLNIILTAYTLDSKVTGKQYIAKVERNIFKMYERGTVVATYIADPQSNILNSTYSETMENSINKVLVYDENGNYMGKVENDGVPGVLQEVHKAEKDIDPFTAARNKLKGIERKASIELVGNGQWDLVVGNGIVIKEKYTGLNGLFFIDGDTHKFENGKHTVSLELAYQNVMDTQESGEEEKKDGQ